MDYREKVLSLAQTQPLLPATVSKALGVTSIVAGAMLSELCAKSLLKTSALKVGGSPLYYVPGNETQLLNYITSLNEKDRKTVDYLREQKIIREKDADPLTRVSLAHIKDFAHPLIVQYEGTQERFWKWFALPASEAETLIRNQLEPPQLAPAQQKEMEPAPIIEPQAAPPAETPRQTTQETEPPAKKEQPRAKPLSSDFWDTLYTFFTSNNIKIIEKNMLKKDEYDLIIRIPTPVGDLMQFCKAKRKKKITDADLSSAYVTGQLKKLPTIYLTEGDLTKKAKDLLPQLQGFTITTLHGR